MRADIGYLNKLLCSVSDCPHGDIGRTALLEMTVMAPSPQTAVVGPIAPNRPCRFDVAHECDKTLLDPYRQQSDAVRAYEPLLSMP